MPQLTLHRRATRHCGVTLLEVLISIGVLSIGLIGVITLIPLAGQQAKEGTEKDALAIAGRRAFRAFSIHGFHDANRWYWGPWPQILRPPLSPTTTTVCLDPRGLRLLDPQATVLQPTASRTFPYCRYATGVSPPPPEIPVLVPASEPWSPSAAPAAMSPALAEEWFVFGDDLAFELPQRSGEWPRQTPLRADWGNGLQPAKRFAHGELSWFAMVSPLASDPHLARLSIVVARGRNSVPQDAVFRGTFDPITQEFAISGASVGGPDEARPSPGDWVMLGYGAEGQGQYVWYRVTTQFGQVVGLQGPVWNAPTAPYLVVTPQIVNVYSKNIRMVPYNNSQPR